MHMILKRTSAARVQRIWGSGVNRPAEPVEADLGCEHPLHLAAVDLPLVIFFHGQVAVSVTIVLLEHHLKFPLDPLAFRLLLGC